MHYRPKTALFNALKNVNQKQPNKIVDSSPYLRAFLFCKVKSFNKIRFLRLLKDLKKNKIL